MVNPKCEEEVLYEYYCRTTEIWNEIDTLRRNAEDALNFVADINAKRREYNGEWPTRLDAMAGLAYRVLNKISALADMYDNEEIFEEQ